MIRTAGRTEVTLPDANVRSLALYGDAAFHITEAMRMRAGGRFTALAPCPPGGGDEPRMSGRLPSRTAAMAARRRTPARYPGGRRDARVSAWAVIAVLIAGAPAVARAQDAPAVGSRTSTVSPPPAPRLPPAPERILLRGSGVTLRLQGGLGAGALPGSGPIMGFSGALRVAPFRYVLHGRLRLSRDALVGGEGGRVASIDLWTVGARMCPEVRVFAAWFALGCLGAEGGRFRAEEPQRSSVSGVWAGAFISAALRAEVAPPFAFWIGSDLGVSLVNAEYSPENSATVSTGAFFGAAEVGVEVSLD